MKHKKILYPIFTDRWHWVILEEVTDDDLCCIYEQFQGEIIEEGYSGYPMIYQNGRKKY